MIKKEVVEGSELTLAMNPLQTLRDFFGTEAVQPAPVFLHSPGYRTLRKKRVEEGRGTRWRGALTGKEREERALVRISERKGRTKW